MEETRYADSNDDTDSDSDSNSTSTDSGVPTKTTHLSHAYNTTTSTTTETTASQDNRPREIAAESDDDDTSSSESSTEDVSVPTHKTTEEISTDIPNDKSVMEHSRDQTTQGDVALRPRPTTNDESLVAKKEAARLSARLGHMSIVDSVVVRKKMRDRIPENVLYDEIGKLVTENTDEVEADKGDDYPKQTQTDQPETKPPAQEPPKEDTQSSQSSDSDKSSINSVPSDGSIVEDGTDPGTPATIEVRQEVGGKWTSDMEEVELDNVVEARDGTATDGSKRGVFSTCCCFRGARTS